MRELQQYGYSLDFQAKRGYWLCVATVSGDSQTNQIRVQPALQFQPRGRDGASYSNSGRKLQQKIKKESWNDQTPLPADHSNVKLKPLINDLFDRIFPQGVSQLVRVPTHAQQGIATKCLDHLYTNQPTKLSEVQAEFTGMSDHKIIKVNRYSKSIKENPRYVRKRTFKNFDKEDFKK